MAKHHWRRGNSGWTFQISIPKTFINRLGANPFRISLGARPAAEAKRRARVLAGYATARMGGEDRETVNRGLAEVAAQLADLKAKATSANFAALRASAAHRPAV
jgi:hypothetical protein